VSSPRAISCYFGKGFLMPLYPCVGCADNKRARFMWRPPFWFQLRVRELQYAIRGPFPPFSRVCRHHTLDKARPLLVQATP